MVIANAEVWPDTFPADPIPRLPDVIVETWQPSTNPAATDHEAPIRSWFR
jgi:hypothetical protein